MKFRLFKSDLILPLLAGIVVLAGSLVGWVLVPRAPWIPALVVGAFAISGLMLELYRRLQAQFKEVAEAQERSTRAAFHQTEAIVSVINTIAPVAPMPSTRTWAASPDILNHLCRLVLTRRPEQVFEVGSGVSTLTVQGGEGHYHAGGGIVADSDPDRELDETNWKAVQLS